YRSFVQNFQGIVYQGHLNFVPVFFHGAVEEITGYQESEFVAGKPRWDQVIHQDDWRQISRIADELRTVPGFADEREYRIIRKDGQIRWVHELIQNVCDESGKPNLVQGALYDITDRKRIEKDLMQHREHLEELVLARTTELTKANAQLQEEIARGKELEKNLVATNEQLQQEIADRKRAIQTLQQTEERFRDFFENAPVGFHIFGPDRKIVDINRAELEMIGYAKDEIVNKKTWADLILPEQRAEFEEHWRRIVAAGQVRSLNYTLVHKDGHYVDVLLNASARFDENGNLLNTRGSVLNVTERKRLERELLNIVERERKRTGQELHDSIGQQLTGIALMLEALGERLADKSLADEVAYAEKAQERIVRAAEQTRNLAKGLHPIDLDRHGLVSAMRILAANTEQFFGVSCRLTCNEAVVTRDASVTMNLYRIAQEAITNAVRHGHTKSIEIGLASEHGWLTMTVENDGLEFSARAGLDEGMGLRIMRHRAEVINGSLDIRKGPKGGTIVTCVLSNRKRP
ncbi:MAG: PAS domain S-box protein, partial [Phycisphaerales bacterium]